MAAAGRARLGRGGHDGGRVKGQTRAAQLFWVHGGRLEGGGAGCGGEGAKRFPKRTARGGIASRIFCHAAGVAALRPEQPQPARCRGIMRRLGGVGTRCSNGDNCCHWRGLRRAVIDGTLLERNTEKKEKNCIVISRRLNWCHYTVPRSLACRRYLSQ